MFPMQGNQPDDKLYVDDVFSAYTYAGNGSTQTINNGIDLAGKGGLVWIKSRLYAANNYLVDTAVGRDYGMCSNNSAAQLNSTANRDLSSFDANGFTLKADYVHSANLSTYTYASWTFRKAPKFFDVVTWTGNGDTGRQIAHSLGIVPGMIICKCTSTTSNWKVGVAGKNLALNTTEAHQVGGTVSGGYMHTGNASATQFYLNPWGGSVSEINASGQTYVAYLFAHDPSTDGIIQCGTFTTDGSGVIPDVNLGWEPQFLLTKGTNAAVNWYVADTARSLNSGVNALSLYPNLSNAEEGSGSFQPKINATGFGGAWQVNKTVAYLAIRRPNKPPTVGTQVYNAIARTGTGAAATVTGVGFAPDMVMPKVRNHSGACTPYDRLRGALAFLQTSATNAESSAFSDTLTAFGMDGVSIGADASFGSINQNTWTYINHFFRRAPGIFDQICTTGTGANKTEAHNLTVAPELWLHKGRSGGTEWVWGSSLLANTQKIVMPSPNGVVTDATAWNSTYPTASVISFGTAATVNTTSATYSTYMWATLAGVSKVSTYTGDGGSGKVIDCGFAAGARFVLIIRITASTAQDIFVWDTVRGIIAGNDPHLSLNTNAVEVTTDDSIDPDVSGFIVNQVVATNINVSGASYIFLAIA